MCVRGVVADGGLSRKKMWDLCELVVQIFSAARVVTVGGCSQGLKPSAWAIPSGNNPKMLIP